MCFLHPRVKISVSAMDSTPGYLLRVTCIWPLSTDNLFAFYGR